jgi:hypothetical protein
MRRFLQAAAILLLIALLLTACAKPTQSGEAILVARQSYRSAALVVLGECLSSHADALGRPSYQIQVNRVFAGAAQVGDLLQCDQKMTPGQSYLLYLQRGADMPHAEDIPGYTLVEGGQPYPVEGSKVTLNGQKLALAYLSQDMQSLSGVISAPGTPQFYDRLQELSKAADNIFIGIVKEAPALVPMQFRAQVGGTTTENTLDATVAKVIAWGGVKGAYNYGDAVDLVFAPGMLSDTLNASTLKPIPYGPANAPELKAGATYLFFTISGADEKQAYSFPVNALQGFILLSGDLPQPSPVAGPLTAYTSLDSLVNTIRKYL